MLSLKIEMLFFLLRAFEKVLVVPTINFGSVLSKKNIK